MTIQWLGHACFRIEADEYAIVLDPYADGKVHGLGPIRPTANAVLCSHNHDDHNAIQVIHIAETGSRSPFTILKIESTHDDEGGARRGPNTIHVLEAHGLRVCHLGDLGTMLTPGQIAAIGRLDALMVPIGGHYTIDAVTAKAVCDALFPTVILPMHYRSESFGFDVLSTLDPFIDQFETIDYVSSDMIEITKDMPPRVAVLSLTN